MKPDSCHQPTFKPGWFFTAVKTSGILLLALLLGACGQSGISSGTPTGAETAVPVTGQTVAVASPTPINKISIPVVPNINQTAVPSPIPIITQAPLSTATSTGSAPQPSPTSSGVTVTQLPDASTAQWVAVTTDLAGPIGIANPGDGSGRLFVIERQGRIRVLVNGQLQDTAYLDITDRVDSRGSEQGLLGLAFHPNFRQNGFFYVNYIDLKGNTVIARFHADPASNQADPSSEKDLLHVKQPYPNHNGGSMEFGANGYLYFGLGDGGSEGDPQRNGQSLTTPLGKLHRIDVDHGDPYAIPPDNPFANQSVPSIWAYGLRNPWRFDFDPLTHALYIGDVGQSSWEEIDYLPPGAPGGTNFGWSYMEGNHPYQGTPPAGANLTPPIFEYSHAQGCAVTGGVVYRGKALPNWQGVYVFGDYCSGTVWGLLRQADGTWKSNVLYHTGYAITSFGRDEQGEIYLTDQRGGLYRLQKP